MTYTISIITPVYNRDFCIERAINSVRQLKKTTGIDYTHIIIDDGSTDNTIKVIQQNMYEKIILIKLSKNQGVNAARNAGIKKAKGKYILLYDSDDELKPNTLKILKHTLDKTKEKHKIYRFAVETTTGKPMSFIKKPYMNVTYEQKLSGKYLKGEFISLINKEVYDTIQYNEKLFCFESQYWNKVSKRFNSEVGINKVVRIYHYDNDDRVSRKLLTPENYHKRAEDYLTYIKEFKEDYLAFKLNKKLSNIFLTAGIYFILAKKVTQGRKFIFKSVSLHKGIKQFFLAGMSYLGVGPFKIMMSIYRRFTK